MLHFVWFIFLVRRNPAFYFFIFYCTSYSNYCTCISHFAFTSRSRANRRISVALFTYSSRGRAICYCVPFLHVRCVRAAFTSRCDSVSLCVAQPSHLIESRYLVIKLHIIAPCVAGLIAPPRRCRVRWRCSLFFCLSARQPLSLARNLPAIVTRDSLTQREAVLRSSRVDSPPRL